jgi:hypothetical protein
MPQRGPPPPSASYTWKFDDGTDDESTDSGDQIVASRRISEETILPVVVPSTSSSADENDDDLEDDKGDDVKSKEEGEPEDDDDSEWGSWAAALIPSASKHKQQSSKQRNNNKSKKNKNKKNKKKQQQKEKKKAVVVKKNLSFGTVRIQRHDRCLGVDVVPLDGSWPLGIGNRLVEVAIEELSVDEHEEQIQQRLRERLAKLDPDESARLRRQHVDDVLETRQWDYRSSAKNPLFHLVTEFHRMELLLRYSEPDHGHDAVVVVPSAEHHYKTSPSTSSNKQRKQLSSSSTRRDSSHAERFDDLFTKADVSHFRGELEDIRARRSIKDATGCSCHRLKVYLPPEHGASGKTAQKKRLAVTKLKNELRKRNLLPKDNDPSASSSSREQLERILHDAVEKEGCCDYDCPCYQNGIGCQSDACDCWQQQPSSNDNNTTSSMTTQDIRDRCGNRHGMYTVDGTVIDEYRRNVLEKLTYCPPVQQQDEENHHTTAHTPQLLNHSNNKKFIGRNLPKLAT